MIIDLKEGLERFHQIKVIELAKKLKAENKPGEGPGASETCPICQENSVRFYIALNGHLYAGCKNKCFQVIE